MQQLSVAMGMICPQCKGLFDHGLECPRCKVPLLYQPAALQANGKAASAAPAWHHTGQGRVVLGFLLAVGLCYGLTQLCSAGLRALGKDGFDSAFGLALLAGLQALALLGVGTISGAGQRQGLVLGATVGLLTAVLVMGGILTGVGALGELFQPWCSADSPVRPLVLYGLPGLLTISGTMGGLAGGLIWKRPPPVAPATVSTTESKSPRGVQTRINLPPPPPKKSLLPWAGPVLWLRVLMGVGVAVVGGVFTKRVIEFILEASEGYLQVVTEVQTRVTTGEVFSLSILIGGVVAGATTPNGLKQGLCVGIGAGAAMVGFFLTGTVPESGSLLFPIFSAVFLGLLGGWFGTELMPPAYHGPVRRRKRGWLDL